MDHPADSNDSYPVFYIGQHETKRAVPVTEDVIQYAQDLNYDMLTSPITTASFHSSVLALLSSYLSDRSLHESPDQIPFPLIPPLKPSDTLLAPSDSISQLVVFTSPWIDLASPDPLIAYVSRQVLNLEIAYAAFCGVVNVVIRGPRLHHGPKSQWGITQYSRAIQEALSLGVYLHVHIHLPMVDNTQDDLDEEIGSLAPFARESFIKGSLTNKSRPTDEFGTWDAWNVIRSVCVYNSRLSIALIIPQRLPSLSIQARWYSEPLRLLMLPANSFIVNARNSFVLSKQHQLLIARYMRLRNAPWMLLCDVDPITSTINDEEAPSVSRSNVATSPTPAEASHMSKSMSKKAKTDPTPHLSYIRYLQRSQPAKTMMERFGAGYQDYLQSPLQPLTDNLESITYEVFEKDPIKYEWYENAITQALKDWVLFKKSPSSSSGEVIVAVVGAGRGPLVTRALQASASTGVRIKLYAVEKNPNAYVLLQRHNEEAWAKQVIVVKSDMRAWRGPIQDDGSVAHVDILVSELLGSFADNELSPECLDGVQHVLNPEHGLSIPTSYTSHLTPIAAPKLHADILGRYPTDSSAFEIPYVVMLHAIDYMSLDPSVEPRELPESAEGRKLSEIKLDIIPTTPLVKTAWSFRHPIPQELAQHSALRRGSGVGGGGSTATGGDGANEHNARFTRLNFICKQRGVCHGLGGYFETVLYEGSAGVVELSTNPINMDTKSKNMISWFPIFFPLKTPIYVPENSELEISMWRHTDDRKVWYEWMVESFATVGWRRVRLGVTEIHSSRKNGCLM